MLWYEIVSQFSKWFIVLSCLVGAKAVTEAIEVIESTHPVTILQQLPSWIVTEDIVIRLEGSLLSLKHDTWFVVEGDSYSAFYLSSMITIETSAGTTA